MQITYVILNGVQIPEHEAQLSINDLAIVRGYGIFDYFKTVQGTPLFLEDNLDRFYNSARLMDLPVNYSRTEIKSMIEQLMLANNMPDSGIKILLTGGYSPDGYSIAEPNLIISQHPITRDDLAENKGIKLLPFEYHRPFSQVKSIDYVMGIQALKKAKEAGANDVVYVQNGLLSECPRANFFLVSDDGTLLTAGDDVLQGITRMKILEVAKEHFKIEVRDISLEDLKNASEAFISSTTKNITPVTEVLGHKEFGAGAGTVTKQLQVLLNQLMYELETSE
ncbi:aminotransferase class IV [Sphingobacterium yanglingense]|uniref:branched-chain-amino-acid transaminase n=1 Tax=Sphingobacterium yanglingense TaxID=1437280 RepID=A0A4R6WFZ4_9SPHI|nr:aminotransferase class IV [Sphingobacterium yanglingense]TDQ76296.1 D-alanine transaminase/branched-chain amino acid aminotransferase [Sphingobacterium yanglingense]